MTKDPKKKEREENELVKDYNPDDVEAGEELPGNVKVKGESKQLEKHRDLNPDDFE